MDKHKFYFEALILFFYFTTGLSAHAEESVKQDIKKTTKDIGHSVKRAGKEVGHTFKKAGKEIGHTSKNVAHTVRDGARKAVGKDKKPAESESK